MVRSRGNRGRGRAGQGQGRGRVWRGRGSRRGRVVTNRQPNLRENSREDDTFVWNDGTESTDVKLRNLFLKNSTFQEHYDAQNRDVHRYLACIIVLLKNNIQLGEKSKALALTAFWARKDFVNAEYILEMPGEVFALKEVLKACTLLDATRNKRAQEKVLKRLEAQGCKKQKKLSKIKRMIAALQTEVVAGGSLSGSLVKHVKSWVKGIPTERLEFFAMHFPTEPWKKLADLCHLHPEKDFPQCPWFLPFCFGKPIPESVNTSTTAELTAENICEKIMATDIDYTVARKFASSLDAQAKERIAKYTKLDTVLWYYEELSCDEVERVIHKRLESGEKPTLSYGKLMERILYFRFCKNATTHMDRDGWPVYDRNPCQDDPAKLSAIQIDVVEEEGLPFTKYLIKEADMQLKEIRFSLEAPVAVMGDRSPSMGVAIKTSNIIASLVTAVSNADLVFFDHHNMIPPFIPKDVEEVLKLCKLVTIGGGTTPAASLYPYYKEKRMFKTFVVVTDEEENGTYNEERDGEDIDSWGVSRQGGYSFTDLFKKYYDEVYPARLVFISFLYQRDPGQMVSEIKNKYPEIKVSQFRFSSARPDLSKLDNVFGLLSSESESFTRDIDEVAKALRGNDVLSMTQLLKL